MSTLLEGLTFVCHQLRSPHNLGAIARILSNFGFGRLRLSEKGNYELSEASKLGVGAEELLSKIQVFDTLGETLTDVVYACGSTSRFELRGRIPLSPEEAAQKLNHHAQRGPVALILGGEMRGLSDDDLSHCQDVLVIPTPGPQPSMNVANATSILAYLCAREGGVEPRTHALPEGARLGTVAALERELGGVLESTGFLNAQAPEYIRSELMRSLTRAQLTQREAELWLGAAAQLKRMLGLKKKP
jgi:tRNA/rRNA methyltransferase